MTSPQFSKPVYISIQDIFPKLYSVIPGWIRGNYYCVTAATGVGKTKFTKYAFVEHSYKYCKKRNIPLKIVYFALEESKIKFWNTIRLDILKSKYGIEITYYQFLGYHEGMTAEINKIVREEIDPIVVDMEKYIEVIDYVSNPTGIYRTSKNILMNLGTVTTGEESKDEHGNKESAYTYSYNHPDQQFMIVVDHIGLINGEKDPSGTYLTKHAALAKWSEYVVRHLCPKYQAMVVNVHQQEMASENNEAFKLGKMEPSTEKLGTNKEIGRDYTVTIGLFNPIKHGMFDYKGLNIRPYGKLYRSFHLIKHRDGEAEILAHMKFGGASSKFEEI